MRWASSNECWLTKSRFNGDSSHGGMSRARSNRPHGMRERRRVGKIAAVWDWKAALIKKKTKSLPVTNALNKTAWMFSVIFGSWLHKL
jgi:hypothetical protein